MSGCLSYMVIGAVVCLGAVSGLTLRTQKEERYNSPIEFHDKCLSRNGRWNYEDCQDHERCPYN